MLQGAASQSFDYLMMENPSTSPSSCNQWEELLPALKLIKSSSGIKKERLLNVVRIIKFLLADDKEKSQCDKILEDINETNEFQCPEIPDIDSIVEERLKPIKEALEGDNCIPSNAFNNEAPKNNTADISKILDKISAALANVKENNEKGTSSTITPIFKLINNGCKGMNQAVFENLNQVGKVQARQVINPLFNIPCQRAADILDETATFVIPKDAYCNLPANMNLKSILNSAKLNPENLPFQIVPNSVTCTDSKDTVAILFKPKKISMMQVYGNLLKKITITVLVPYYVSKLVV